MEFIKNTGPAETHMIEMAAKRRIKELNGGSDKDGVRKYLTLRANGEKIYILEKCNGTSHSLSLEEIKKLNLAEYKFSPRVEKHLEKILSLD